MSKFSSSLENDDLVFDDDKRNLKSHEVLINEPNKYMIYIKKQSNNHWITNKYGINKIAISNNNLMYQRIEANQRSNKQ